MDKDTEIIRTSLRMNRRLYDRLAEAADNHGLTMHAEIISRLQSSVDFDDHIANQGPPPSSVDDAYFDALDRQANQTAQLAAEKALANLFASPELGDILGRLLKEQKSKT